MSESLFAELSDALAAIDRPSTFCTSGSAPVVLPGLEVHDLGTIGLPLTADQAGKLKALCEQAPYGKGEETLVDINVRRVWRLTPDRFVLTNPEWEEFLQQTVQAVQKDLGLEAQQLESHLYDLLLYEPGSFFRPHRDGEKLDRMVATLVVVLPSAFEGGELVVRHDGQEQVLDFGAGKASAFRLHYAAFYADCEHEIRPMRSGYRLCLVYNLALAKGKNPIQAPRPSERVEPIARLLHTWADQDPIDKLVVLLAHQYTAEGLTWDALKGADRSKAGVLAEAATQAGCRAYLGLLTLHESGSAEGEDYSYRRSRYHDEDDDAGNYTMGEVFETNLSAEHWSDPDGQRLAFGQIPVDEGELLDAETLTEVDPEEQFEGYTGNAGMTLDRWYRHGAIFLWPAKRHFAMLCAVGSSSAVAGLGQLMEQWKKSGAAEPDARRAECLDFAAAIISTWKENSYRASSHQKPGPDVFLSLLSQLDDPGLIQAYLREVVGRDAAVNPGEELVRVCQRHGLATFVPQLDAVFQKSTGETIERNVGLLESLCLTNAAKQDEWREQCRSLAGTTVEALEAIDAEPKAPPDYRLHVIDRVKVLAGLARALVATGHFGLLHRVVLHALARPELYSLTEVHLRALTELGPWLQKNLKKPCPPLNRWIEGCGEQLESLTGKAPPPPADYRRPAEVGCRCNDCAELARFLESPNEREHRFSSVQARRSHLESIIKTARCDLDCRTERTGSPHTLVCTKNDASYRARLAKFHRDQQHLTALRSIQSGLAK